MNSNQLTNDKLKLITQVAFGLSLLFFYDVYFDLAVSFFHSVLMLSHLLFETCEQLLDHLVEHLFQTSPRATEIIVFYIMASVIGMIAFLILRAIPRWYCSLCEAVTDYYREKKAALITWWQHQTLMLKVKWYSLFMASSFLMVFLAFS